MATLTTQQPMLTLINTFTVKPERQKELIELLVRATDDVIKHLPGFISANIHRGTDGNKVANYAQWRSFEDFQAMLQNPEAQIHMKAAAEIADRFEPMLYQLESCHDC